ncbi:MAG: hypothetical protein HQ510_04730 [Candidatus Marinimicrobia bacterium]|nr:hypothetical protein [Candidatus Neomarinimicrobiota bacterium]
MSKDFYASLIWNINSNYNRSQNSTSGIDSVDSDDGNDAQELRLVSEELIDNNRIVKKKSNSNKLYDTNIIETSVLNKSFREAPLAYNRREQLWDQINKLAETSEWEKIDTILNINYDNKLYDYLDYLSETTYSNGYYTKCLEYLSHGVNKEFQEIVKNTLRVCLEPRYIMNNEYYSNDMKFISDVITSTKANSFKKLGDILATSKLKPRRRSELFNEIYNIIAILEYKIDRATLFRNSKLSTELLSFIINVLKTNKMLSILDE